MKNEKGNILFIILIAIALFGALSYAMTRSSSNSSSIDKEVTSLNISETLQYTGSISKAIGRMRSINGCSNTEISFDGSVLSGYFNPSAPADKSCHVFDVNGGAVNYIPPSNGFNDGSDWVYSGSVRMYDLGGVTVPELITYLPNLTLNACLEINRKLGILNPSGMPPRGLNSLAVIKFIGSYSTTDGIGNLDAEVKNQPSSCFEETSTGNYFFVHTLIIR